jgi:hypothetical protein
LAYSSKLDDARSRRQLAGREALHELVVDVDRGRQRAAVLEAHAAVVEHLVPAVLGADVGVLLDRVVEQLEVALAALDVLGEVAGLLGVGLHFFDHLALIDGADLHRTVGEV